MTGTVTTLESCIVCGSRTDLETWTFKDVDADGMPREAEIVECARCLQDEEVARRRRRMRLV